MYFSSSAVQTFSQIVFRKVFAVLMMCAFASAYLQIWCSSNSTTSIQDEYFHIYVCVISIYLFFSRLLWKQNILICPPTWYRCMILSDWCSTFAIFKWWIKTSISSNESHCFEIHLNMKIEMVSCDSMKTPSHWWRVKFFFLAIFPFVLTWLRAKHCFLIKFYAHCS